MKITKRKLNDMVNGVEEPEYKKKRVIKYMHLVHVRDGGREFHPYYVPLEEVIASVLPLMEAFQKKNGLIESEALLTLLPQSLNYTYGLQGIPRITQELYNELDEILAGNTWYQYKSIPRHAIELVHSIPIVQRDGPDEEEEEEDELY